MLSTAKPKLQTDIEKILYKALYEAYMTTYEISEYSDPAINKKAKEFIEKSAHKFAKKASDEAGAKLATSIYDFVSEIGIMATPKMLVSPMGPVTGVIGIPEFKVF